MGRSRVTYGLISNESARRATFKKRKSGLLKKLQELTTLCGVVACAVIFSSYDEQPEVWPSPSEACAVLEEFKTSPENKQRRYMMDQETLLRRGISRAKTELEKERRSNKNLELDQILAEGPESITGKDLFDLNCFKNLDDIIQFTKENIRFISDKIEFAEKGNKRKYKDNHSEDTPRKSCC